MVDGTAFNDDIVSVSVGSFSSGRHVDVTSSMTADSLFGEGPSSVGATVMNDHLKRSTVKNGKSQFEGTRVRELIEVSFVTTDGIASSTR